MASGVCGDGPTAHDSDARLATLVPEVARYRDTFYGRLLETVGGDHGDLLRAEAKRLKQPFGGIRQHLNQELAKQRAAQLQNHELSILLAEMGFPDASRHYAGRIPTTSARILSEIAIRQTSAELAAGDGRARRGGRPVTRGGGPRHSRDRVRGARRPVEHPRLPGPLSPLPGSRRTARTTTGTRS